MNWNVEIIQDSEVISPKGNNEIHIQKKPFVLKVKMDKPLTIQLNVSDNDCNFNKINPGLPMDFEKATGFPGFHCFISGTGFAEDPFNMEEVLYVFDKGNHYLSYDGENKHRWTRVIIKPDMAIFERNVSSLYINNIDKQIELQDFKGNTLYLVFLLKHLDDNLINIDELQKIILFFEKSLW